MHPEHSPDESIYGEHATIQKMQHIEHSKLLPWLMMCCILSSIALVLAIVSACASWWEAKEVKQLQIQTMDQNALLIREGLKQPSDTIYGPAGNLEYKPREKK